MLLWVRNCTRGFLIESSESPPQGREFLFTEKEIGTEWSHDLLRAAQLRASRPGLRGWDSLSLGSSLSPYHTERTKAAADKSQERIVSAGSDGKESTCNARDPGSIPGSGKAPGEGKGNPLQYSCLENPMDRGAWQVSVPEIAKSRTQLSNWHYHFFFLPEMCAKVLSAAPRASGRWALRAHLRTDRRAGRQDSLLTTFQPHPKPAQDLARSSLWKRFNEWMGREFCFKPSSSRQCQHCLGGWGSQRSKSQASPTRPGVSLIPAIREGPASTAKSQEQERFKIQCRQLPPNPSFASLKKLLCRLPTRALAGSLRAASRFWAALSASPEYVEK